MYGYGYYGWDWTYILVIIGAILCAMASSHITTVYNRYARVRAACGMTGAEVAQTILNRNNVTDVTIHHISGNLTDHYNPSKGTVNLSDAVYGSCSVAALGVAAHECGHVMQHEKGYVPLQIRTALVPVANFGSNAGIWVVLFSLIFGWSTLAEIGVILFSAGVLFQLVTLPVEFNASHRALVMLKEYGILGEEEEKQARAVLTAAALTYVAAAASAILQLLRLIALSSNRRDRNS